MAAACLHNTSSTDRSVVAAIEASFSSWKTPIPLAVGFLHLLTHCAPRWRANWVNYFLFFTSSAVMAHCNRLTKNALFKRQSTSRSPAINRVPTNPVRVCLQQCCHFFILCPTTALPQSSLSIDYGDFIHLQSSSLGFLIKFEFFVAFIFHLTSCSLVVSGRRRSDFKRGNFMRNFHSSTGCGSSRGSLMLMTICT